MQMVGYIETRQYVSHMYAMGDLLFRVVMGFHMAIHVVGTTEG